MNRQCRRLMFKKILLFLSVALWAQEAPIGIPVEPSLEEAKALKALSGKIQGKIVWSTSRANSKHDIWIMNADATHPKALTQSNQVDWFPRISPDGTKVLFNRSKSGWVSEDQASDPEKWDLWMIDIDGRNEQLVVSNATWGTFRPDAKNIVFSRASKVFLMDLESKKETMILDGEKAFNTKGVILQEPNMSPDGKHIAMTLRGSLRETGVWDIEKKIWTKSGGGCQIDWYADGSRLYRVNSTGNGGTAAPSEILWFNVKDGKPVEKIGFFGIPEAVRLMDLPGRRSHEYFPKVSPDGKWLVWGATDKGHDHDIYDYELYLWKIGEPVQTATRITFHTGNDRWPDIWLGKIKEKSVSKTQKQEPSAEKESKTIPTQNQWIETHEYRIQDGQSVILESKCETNKSLCSLSVYTRRSKLDIQIHLETDKISEVLLEDLTGDGLEEIIVVTESAAKGSYKDVYAFIPQKKGPLSVLSLNSWKKESLPKNYHYSGGDVFKIKNKQLIRKLPDFEELSYSLRFVDGGWSFELNKD